MLIVMTLVDPLSYISNREKVFTKIILYMDLDAFFAAVEIRENPAFVGKPLIVGGDPITRRGVVSTCSYEARKFGIHSGMPLAKALQLCPNAVTLRGSRHLYSNISDNINSILKQYSPLVKKTGIDEAFMDITNIVKDYEEAEQLAYELKDEIYANERLTCSIGIAPNKILAKMASNINKPDGLSIMKPEDIKSILSPLKIDSIPGIGPKSKKYFTEQGVITCGHLARCSIDKVHVHWGNHGLKLWKLVNGFNTESTEKYLSPRSRKSKSDEKTFFFPLTSWDEVWHNLNDSISTIVSSAKKSNFRFRTITMKIRFRNFETNNRSHTLPCYINTEKQVAEVIAKLLKEYRSLSPSDIRLIGVKISDLQKIAKTQTDLIKFFSQ